MAVVHGKPESFRSQTAPATASAIPTPLQLAALKMRKGSLGSDMPPTDSTLASPGETAGPQGWKEL